MTTEMKGFFLILQGCCPFTSFCLQIQYVFSFRIYFFQYHSHFNCWLSFSVEKTCKMVMNVNIYHDLRFFRWKKMLSECLLWLYHKISTLSWKQKGKNVNKTTKTSHSVCTESSSLQNLLISYFWSWDIIQNKTPTLVVIFVCNCNL